jgi:hypothetical protein
MPVVWRVVQSLRQLMPQRHLTPAHLQCVCAMGGAGGPSTTAALEALQNAARRGAAGAHAVIRHQATAAACWEWQMPEPASRPPRPSTVATLRRIAEQVGAAVACLLAC